MFVNARQLPSGQVLRHEVCIVGSGPAGISVARELANANLDVAVLESGGLEYEPETQSLYDDEAIGFPYEPLVANRLRFFGGSSNHWAGFCKPFGPRDFEARDWIPHSSWPIGYHDITPYLPRAFDLCTFGRAKWEWSGEYWAERLGHGYPHPLLETVFEDSIAQQARATWEERNRRNKGISFGRIHKAEIGESSNITVYLFANVIDVIANEDASRVERLHVATLDGKRLTAEAAVFVLACGGIENVRLLLASNSVQPEGLGNSSDTLGRYFMDHLHPQVGRIVVTGTPYERGGFQTLYSPIRLRRPVVRQERLTNVSLSLTKRIESDYRAAAKSDGVKAIGRLARSFKDGAVPNDLMQDIAAIVLDFDDVAKAGYAKLFPATIPVEYYTISSRVEAVPNPDSRITLSAKRGWLEKPKARLNWQLSSIDYQSAKRTIELLGKEVGRLGYGRVQWSIEGDDFPRQPMKVGHHHMGTTRMSSNPKDGVVDSNCRVHNVSNLYVAGSSVFCTGGSGTPTLMLVALALRLADHLKSKLA